MLLVLCFSLSKTDFPAVPTLLCLLCYSNRFSRLFSFHTRAVAVKDPLQDLYPDIRPRRSKPSQDGLPTISAPEAAQAHAQTLCERAYVLLPGTGHDWEPHYLPSFPLTTPLLSIYRYPRYSTWAEKVDIFSGAKLDVFKVPVVLATAE